MHRLPDLELQALTPIELRLQLLPQLRWEQSRWTHAAPYRVIACADTTTEAPGTADGVACC